MKKADLVNAGFDDIDDPIELFSISREGGESETVMRVLGHFISEQKRFILSNFANMKPDLAEYAKLSGKAQLMLAMESKMNVAIAEGKEAVALLRKQNNQRGS